VAMALTLVLTLPFLVPGVLAVVLPQAVLGWVTLVVGVAVGTLVLLLGVRWGARVYDRRSPELLQRVMSHA
jgi:ABC-2 type transport system permease protein